MFKMLILKIKWFLLLIEIQLLHKKINWLVLYYAIKKKKEFIKLARHL